MLLTFLNVDEKTEKTENPFYLALRDAMSHSYSYIGADDRGEYILRTHPIPPSNMHPEDAKFRRYLHYVVEHVDMDKPPEIGAAAAARMLKLLLDHGGADPAERDENGDTALAIWLSVMIAHPYHLHDRHYGSRFEQQPELNAYLVMVKILAEPLSLGVLNGKNRDGKSGADLAEDLLVLLSKDTSTLVVAMIGRRTGPPVLASILRLFRQHHPLGLSREGNKGGR